MTCPTCHRPEREDEIHSWSPPGVHDTTGRPIPPACYTEEGDAIDPLEEDLPVHQPGCRELYEVTPGRDRCTCHRPRPDELSAVAPDPWLDPDAAAAHFGLPF